jgi:hypothetical protein
MSILRIRIQIVFGPTFPKFLFRQPYEIPLRMPIATPTPAIHPENVRYLRKFRR